MCVFRVVWVFGDPVKGPVVEITPTHLRPTVLATLRQADHVTHDILRRHSKSVLTQDYCHALLCV